MISKSDGVKSFLIILDLYSDLLFVRGRFIAHIFNEGVHSKKLDDSESELLYNGNSTGGAIIGRVLTPCFKDQCVLTLNIDSLTLLFINQDFKVGDKKDILLPEDKDYGGSTQIGENKILILCGNILILYEIGFVDKKLDVKKLSQNEVEGIKGRNDVPALLSASENGIYVMVFFSGGLTASGLVMFKIGKNYQFERKNHFDFENKGIEDNLSSLFFVKNDGGVYYFCGVPDVEGDKQIFTFGFNEKNSEIFEDRKCRKNSNFGSVFRFMKKEGEMSFVGLSSDNVLVEIEYK